MTRMIQIGMALGWLGFFACALLGGVWATLAAQVQLGSPWPWGVGALAVVVGFVAIRARMSARRKGWAVLVLAALLVGAAYSQIIPRHDRNWAFDVAQQVTARIDGDTVALSNVRNFDWSDPQTATIRWEDRSYDLSKLDSVDMLTSVWDSPDIAHLLVSFGFSDGERVVWSVEIRKEQGEAFSELGGFFRAFELVLIAATEDDIVRLRTNARGETVSLFPVDLSPQQRRDLFLSYVTLAQQLEAEPQFYNTLTANCTTTVYKLAKVLRSDLPLDWRLVLSGHLPDYVASLGGMAQLSEAEKAAAVITPRAQAIQPRQDYSTVIRSH